jgi:hypothetical protein
MTVFWLKFIFYKELYLICMLSLSPNLIFNIYSYYNTFLYRWKSVLLSFDLNNRELNIMSAAYDLWIQNISFYIYFEESYLDGCFGTFRKYRFIHWIVDSCNSTSPFKRLKSKRFREAICTSYYYWFIYLFLFFRIWRPIFGFS